MFDFSYNFKLPCQTCTAAEFEKLVTSERVRKAIARARDFEMALCALKPDDVENRKKYEAEKAKAKQALPCLMFQATFAPMARKQGEQPKKWRKNSAAVLNGLFIVDIDHISNPKEEWQTIMEIALKSKIQDRFMLAFITASGHGLKLVCKADDAIGDIAANQQWLCETLCIEFDEACKDAARVSFCPSKEDILFLDNTLFEYNNEQYESKYGTFYRTGAAPIPTSQADSPKAQPQEQQETEKKTIHENFHGVPYTRIVEEYERLKGGKASEGERHHRIQQMAIDFRHICDKDYDQLLWVLRLSETAKEIEGRKPGEIEDLAAGAVKLRNSTVYPETIRQACANCGITLEKKVEEGHDIEEEAIHYDYWWRRLQPLLRPELNREKIRDPYAEAVKHIEDGTKLGGVLAAGCMLGTYLSKCYYKFYDAKLYRFSYMNYVVGPPASGKSFIIDIDRVLMYELKRQDDVWRNMEREYAEQKERNEQTKGTKESKVMDKPHVPIRYVPSTISNHVLYNRLRDAVDPDDKMGCHLHLFTMESELATAMRSQVGSWAGKRDLELKSFQNEWAGVDFANTGSANGLIQINWNQCISTTEDSMKKKFLTSINDGLITRIALWIMPDREGEMIAYQGDKEAKTGAMGLSEQDMKLVEVCQKFSRMEGTLPCEPLIRCAWEWCEQRCEEVKVTGDRLIEYFRKRIPHYMVRYTLPRILARDYDSYMQTGQLNVTEEDKEFARLIGDWLMYISVRTWGKPLLDYWDDLPISGLPKQSYKAMQFLEKFNNLPDVFTLEDFEVGYSSRNSAKTTLNRLVKKGVIVKTEDGKWKKKINT